MKTNEVKVIEFHRIQSMLKNVNNSVSCSDRLLWVSGDLEVLCAKLNVYKAVAFCYKIVLLFVMMST